jgi:hypothetical protein
MTLAEAVQASQSKSNEAAFFIGKMREVESSSHHDLTVSEVHFGYYLSAFLSAARSVLQILGDDRGENRWPAINALISSWTPEEQTLERTLTNARDVTVHRGQGVADSTVEMVPESEIPRAPRHPFDGYVIISRPPGIPEPRIGVRTFTILINGKDEQAVSCCLKYLDLINRIIAHFGASIITMRS